ncbi:hypothetical protein H2198_005218 [Neophaeococcomyces mojaviensis]|uniref:Uncharacterized protein n=1 Tax=Neophaeococcomyces mojaviensis TaxID=3383035 RepID=A0ACC3A6F9_9EURO|nr:hypothetical protein H2198_005218 [Knufia sp. JES_112]
MLITIKRPAWLLGLSVFFIFITWQTYGRVSSNWSEHGQFFNSFFPGSGAFSSKTHDVVFSSSTINHEYFMIDFGDQPARNPNIIPHPLLEETWIVVAQLIPESQYYAELVCNAMFVNDTLQCINHAVTLPIAPTYGDKCVDDLAYITLNKGPHDARVFHGPNSPYTIYGSNSKFTCFGQWIQDFRSLIEWEHEYLHNDDFVQATELQRPPPYHDFEKNWFLFWSRDDEVYVHYDVVPRRVFAKLEFDGSVGPDLAVATQGHDEKCIEKYMPKIGPQLESIHQATNSLSISMCRRNDRACTPDESNTFIFTIFQHKTYFNFHPIYEPYVMLFEQIAPFAIHAMSKRPFWIHGRKGADQDVHQAPTSESDELQPPVVQGEMFYVTSMSWKTRGQKYHGYIDDVLFVAFGIEDEKTGGIDVVAGDLLHTLGTC